MPKMTNRRKIVNKLQEAMTECETYGEDFSLLLACAAIRQNHGGKEEHNHEREPGIAQALPLGEGAVPLEEAGDREAAKLALQRTVPDEAATHVRVPLHAMRPVAPNRFTDDGGRV